MFFGQKLRQRPVLSLSLASLLAHIPAFFIPFLHTDEGIFITMAKFSIFGDLYHHVVDHKPPFLSQFVWALSGGGQSMELLHLNAALWSAVGAVYFFRSLRFFLDEKQAFSAAFFYALLIGVIHSGAFTTERALLPFVMLSLWFALRLSRLVSTKALFSSFLSGLFLGAGACIKQTAVLIGIAPIFLILAHKNRLQHFLSFAVGAMSFTLLSWWISGTSWNEIIREGYLANFSVVGVQFNNPQGVQSVQGVYNDLIFVLGWLFLPVTLGTVAGIVVFLKRARFSFFKDRALILLLISSVTGVLSLTMSGRYAQNYFLGVLPVMCVVSSLALTGAKTKRAAVALTFWIVAAMLVRTVSNQWNDKNKNWDSQIQQVVDEIKKTTDPSARIWITNAIPSIYFLTDREPAVRNIVLMHTMSYIDLCRASENQIREYPENPRYQDTLKELDDSKPAVIFWVNRAVNTCMDRVKIERFPALEKFILENYHPEWSNRLGIFYRRHEAR